MSLAYRHIHAEIQYETEDGNVHSDLCAEGEAPENNMKWRKLLHDCLDEWLYTSNGTGIFYVGDPDVIQYDKEN